MEFSVGKEDLLQCLYLVQGVVERRSSLPMLSHVLIESISAGENEGMISLGATDLEIGIRQQCQAEVQAAGSMTADARKLYEIIRELPSGQIRLRSSGNGWVDVTSGKSRFRIASLDPKEFPTITGQKEKQEESSSSAPFISLPGPTLREMIEKTLFATSPDETRLNLSGVYLETEKEGTVRMVASDGHRLSLIERAVDTPALPDWPSVILPKKGLVETRKLLEKSEGTIDVSVNDSVVNLKKETTELFMRLIEGDFPDYQQVVPKEHTHRIEFPRDELLSALRRILILTTERSRGIKLQFEKDKIEVSVNTPDVGEGTEEIAASYAGDGLSIGFNGRYLTEALNVMNEGDAVVIFLKDEMSPGLLQQKESPAFSYVIMPMKIN